MGHLLKIKCVDSRENLHILASTSVLFILTTVQVPKTVNASFEVIFDSTFCCLSCCSLSAYSPSQPVINFTLTIEPKTITCCVCIIIDTFPCPLILTLIKIPYLFLSYFLSFLTTSMPILVPPQSTFSFLSVSFTPLVTIYCPLPLSLLKERKINKICCAKTYKETMLSHIRLKIAASPHT